MSANKIQPERALKIALLIGLMGFAGATLAEEEEVPDLEFLEYLGSWDESDEDWILFAGEDTDPSASGDDKDEGAPAPQEDKVAELEDES